MDFRGSGLPLKRDVESISGPLHFSRNSERQGMRIWGSETSRQQTDGETPVGVGAEERVKERGWCIFSDRNHKKTRA